MAAFVVRHKALYLLVALVSTLIIRMGCMLQPHGGSSPPFSLKHGPSPFGRLGARTPLPAIKKQSLEDRFEEAVKLNQASATVADMNIPQFLENANSLSWHDSDMEPFIPSFVEENDKQSMPFFESIGSFSHVAADALPQGYKDFDKEQQQMSTTKVVTQEQLIDQLLGESYNATTEGKLENAKVVKAFLRGDFAPVSRRSVWLDALIHFGLMLFEVIAKMPLPYILVFLSFCYWLVYPFEDLAILFVALSLAMLGYTNSSPEYKALHRKLQSSICKYREIQHKLNHE